MPVRSSVARDEEAELFSLHSGPILEHFASQVGRHVAEDLTAQTFAEAWDSRDAYDPALGSEAAWVWGIAANVLRHYRRDEGRRARACLALASQARVDDGSDSLIEEVAEAIYRAERWAVLAPALDRMSAGDREVLLLACQPDVRYRIMAEHLGVPVGTLRSRLSRARNRLETQMAALGAG